MSTTRSPRRTLAGTVVSASRAKTIAVQITTLTAHPKYGKYVRRRNKVHAHDESNEARVGDEVELVETRPLSRTKRWRLVRVVRRGGAAALAPAVALESGVTEALGQKS